MNYIDCHNHSDFSFDGKFSVYDMCKTAQEKGLYAFAITDHADVNEYAFFDGFPTPDEVVINIKNSVNEINLLKDKFNIKLIAGVELGQQFQNEKCANEILSIDGLDFVIGSLHCAKGDMDFYDVNFSKVTNKTLVNMLDRYYNEFIYLSKHGDYDVLGHLTYPFRYFYKAQLELGDKCPSFDLYKYDEAITEIMKNAISRGKRIEINTSGLKRRTGVLMPEMRHIEMYYRLGGTIISLGSDSHEPKYIKTGITETQTLLKQIGFKHLSYYMSREPRTIPI